MSNQPTAMRPVVSPFYNHYQVRGKIIQDIITQRQNHIAAGHTLEVDAKASVFDLVFKAAGTHLTLAFDRDKFVAMNRSPIAINREQIIKAISILMSVLELHDLAVIEQEQHPLIEVKPE